MKRIETNNTRAQAWSLIIVYLLVVIISFLIETSFKIVDKINPIILSICFFGFIGMSMLYYLTIHKLLVTK
jgi:ribose/xylose/arabinose/galactoside ABC-type transport system permease subunit